MSNTELTENERKVVGGTATRGLVDTGEPPWPGTTAGERFNITPMCKAPLSMDSEMAERAPSLVAILEATRQVITVRGSGKFTFSAIAAAAGVSRPTLYRWFATKEDLLEALADYEKERFERRLRASIEAQSTPATRLDAALSCLVTYLDALMGPDPIGAHPALALRSLATSLAPQTASFVRQLGAALDAVPAVRRGRLSRHGAAALFLRVAYSHYLFPHPEPTVLITDLRALAGLPLLAPSG